MPVGPAARRGRGAGVEPQPPSGGKCVGPFGRLATWAGIQVPTMTWPTMGAMTKPTAPPILADKHYSAPSAFVPGNLLREARRQKGLQDCAVPAICVLDPDGDIVRQTKADGRAVRDPAWACYHTDLYRLSDGSTEFGIVPCAVGAPFAVLIAEQLFASGCRFLISVTSSGQLVSLATAAVLHSDREGAARRRHELPLPARSGVQRSLTLSSRSDAGRVRRRAGTGQTRRRPGPPTRRFARRQQPSRP